MDTDPHATSGRAQTSNGEPEDSHGVPTGVSARIRELRVINGMQYELNASVCTDGIPIDDSHLLCAHVGESAE